MTANDYAEIGIPVPEHQLVHILLDRGFDPYDDPRVADPDELRSAVGNEWARRCEECGDTTGECGC